MGENNALAFFYLLKKEVEKVYLLKKSSHQTSIHEWTVNQIKDFQEDLENQLNERISERWFYMHMKPKVNEKIPRIDMLNILCKYVGYISWDDFKLKKKMALTIASKKEEQDRTNKSKRLVKSILLFGGIMAIGLSVYWIKGRVKIPKYTFCFYDRDTRIPIIDTALELTVLTETQSPIRMFGDEKGCFEVETREEQIKFEVKAPYYKLDTIDRLLINKKEKISLRRDDYALMILLFANSDVKDWEKRREQLDKMISEDAVIFQITTNNTGMEMYNKTDFINKLTTPLESLGAIEIIETIYDGDKIVNLRFIQK